MSTAPDIVLGLALCYALVSLFCTAIQEFIAQALDSRGKLLVQALYSINFAKLVKKLGTNFLANPGNLGSGQSGTPQSIGRKAQAVTVVEKTEDSHSTMAAGESSTEAQKDENIFVQNRRSARIPMRHFGLGFLWKGKKGFI